MRGFSSLFLHWWVPSIVLPAMLLLRASVDVRHSTRAPAPPVRALEGVAPPLEGLPPPLEGVAPEVVARTSVNPVS